MRPHLERQPHLHGILLWPTACTAGK
jgi:hypothetical protein